MKLQQQRQVIARPGKPAECPPESSELLRRRNAGSNIRSGIAQGGRNLFLLDKVVNSLQYVYRRTTAVPAAREKNFDQKSKVLAESSPRLDCCVRTPARCVV